MGQSDCLAFALAMTMADSTSSTVTLRALAKGLSACLAGSRLVRPNSHLTYVGTDMCARAARVRALSPADVRRRRRSAGPPASRRSAASTSRTRARRSRISGRGAELPSSQREIRSPPATSMSRANSCWVRPIRTRASRRAAGLTPDSTRTNDSLGADDSAQADANLAQQTPHGGASHTIQWPSDFRVTTLGAPSCGSLPRCQSPQTGKSARLGGTIGGGEGQEQV